MVSTDSSPTLHSRKPAWPKSPASSRFSARGEPRSPRSQIVSSGGALDSMVRDCVDLRVPSAALLAATDGACWIGDRRSPHWAA